MLQLLRNTAASGAFVILSSWGLASATLGASPELLEGQARYQPIQSITYEFGSKLVSGYFDRAAGACVVTFMITEKMDPENMLAVTPVRLRLILQPDQIAGLDSEEGQSLNVTCEESATSLLVEIGERDKLVTVQNASLVEQVAQPK